MEVALLAAVLELEDALAGLLETLGEVLSLEVGKAAVLMAVMLEAEDTDELELGLVVDPDELLEVAEDPDDDPPEPRLKESE